MQFSARRNQIELKTLFIQAIAGLFYVFVVVSALVFLPAWTLDYWQAWAFLTVFFVSLSAIFTYLAKYDTDLLARRVKTAEKEKSQRLLRLLVDLTFAGIIVVSALDHRFAWSSIPPPAVFVGDTLVLLGLLVIFFVFRANTYTAQTVEVEAGQTVVSTGPYAFVRHPMYVGGLIFVLGIPPALGSLWGLLGLALFVPVMAWRILDEEELLGRGLPGYEEYRNKVKYRLIPFVW